LRDLLSEIEIVSAIGDLDRDVTGLAYDSRRVRPGDAFFALRGLKQDGQRFVRDALASGAVAAVVGPEVGAEAGIEGGTVVTVGEPRLALALGSRAFHGNPSASLAVAGVTGTNGKTTTTYLLESIFRAAGRKTGVIGTTGYRIGDESRVAPFTTPEAPELQGLLREMVDRGVDGVAIEISSHALVQRRCFGLECDVALFTNLSHDHLDYHGSLESYFDAKLMLFDGRNELRRAKRATAVINADDERAPRVVEAAARGGLAVLRYGRAAGSDVAIQGLQIRPRGLAFELRHAGRSTPIELPLLGRYNAWNAAGAFGAALALEIAPEVAARGLAEVRGVPGRLERIDQGQPFEVVVDYAHTPDALSASLSAAREHTRGRLLLVFGCGGDRDRFKRPLMGRVAAEQSDRAWITNDNPRSEDPARIAHEIAEGATRPLDVVLDRRRAIEQAVRAARPGDTVLIAGKGHETTQTIGDQVLPFDDRAVAAEVLRLEQGVWP
jgi:UDP-N-acetylmuramoyl-L-alanyl-D-glutamate--2,6-diaminopimelate ligase